MDLLQVEEQKENFGRNRTSIWNKQGVMSFRLVALTSTIEVFCCHRFSSGGEKNGSANYTSQVNVFRIHSLDSSQDAVCHQSLIPDDESVSSTTSPISFKKMAAVKPVKEP